MKQTALFEVVGENSALVYEKSSVRKLKENLKHQRRAPSKAGPHIILSGVHVPTFFFL